MSIARFIPIAALAAVAVYAAPASATTYSFGTITPGTTAFTNPPIVVPVGPLNDTFTFNLTAGGLGNAQYSELEFTPFFDIGPVTLTVTDTDTSMVLFTGLLTSNLPVPLLFMAGNYSANLTGTVSGTAGGSYAFSVSAPAVPEPAAWGTMLLGLGLAGSLARRRQRTLAAA